jgi:hypothetical protein
MVGCRGDEVAFAPVDDPVGMGVACCTVTGGAVAVDGCSDGPGMADGEVAGPPAGTRSPANSPPAAA